MNNRDRILDMSLALMNEEGARAVGTTRIAEALGISPGNLYYHFKNREEIVRILFGDMEEEVRAALSLEPNDAITNERFAGFYLGAFRVQWKYRFFFGSLLQLLRLDEELAVRYRSLQAWSIAQIESIVRQMEVSGGQVARPITEAQTRSIALNMWLLYMNWIRHLQISGRGDLTEADMAAGVEQIFDVLAPYLEPTFEAKTRAVLRAAGAS
ncbi:MAG: TetR/AcrR family transcriptional regulator [Pseudomonadota bacterium]